jgi:hypothetical protein
MVRTQIQLTSDQSAALRRLAGERGVSVAALLREAADSIVASGVARHRENALRAIGAYASGRTDVSSNHDDHFVDTLAT